MLVYPSGIDVSTSALRRLSARLRTHRRERGTRWRRLTPGRQALLALAHLRCGHLWHGMNVQVLADPHRRLLRASPALPGSTHDLTAARSHGIIDALAEAGLAYWADKGYQGAGGTVRVPFRGRHRHLPAGQQAVNVAHARIRAIGEQAMATLKGWRLLRKLRCGTTRITAIVQAVLALHLAASG